MLKKVAQRYPEYSSNILYIITSNYPASPAIAKIAKVIDMQVCRMLCVCGVGVCVHVCFVCGVCMCVCVCLLSSLSACLLVCVYVCLCGR